MLPKNFNFERFMEKYKLEVTDENIKKIVYAFESAVEAFELAREIHLSNLPKRHRVKEIEHIIATDVRFTYYYCNSCINGPCPELEFVILTSPEYSYYYARDIIRDRWPKAEQIILTDSIRFDYAKYIMKKKWLEAEAVPMKHGEQVLRSIYDNHFRTIEEEARENAMFQKG